MQKVTVDVRIKELKKAIALRLKSNIFKMQLGHPYKIDKDLNIAVDLLEMFEGCFNDKEYYRLIDIYTKKLQHA